jgi:aryl-alcohol dehydrogenase-like predicted oxidoreductase
MDEMDIPRVELAPGYSIPRHIVGLWQLSAGHQRSPTSDEDALTALEQYFDAGFDTFDCADIYTGVEEILGRFRARLGARAEHLKVHTKFVPHRDALAHLDRDTVVATIDRSLRRLRAERLDLVQFAWWDYDVPAYVQVLGWLGELQTAGKIRLLGTTNFDVARLREMEVSDVVMAVHQVQYSLLDRRPQRYLTDYLDRQGGAMVCYGSLAGGFLTGGWLGKGEPDGGLANRSLTKYRLMIDEAGGWELYQRLLGVVAEIARQHGVDPAHVASAWVLAQPVVAAVIVGMRSTGHLSAANRAFSFWLTAEDQDRIDSLHRLHQGPRGDIFGLEREPTGPHAAIMWTDLNRRKVAHPE